METPRRLTSDQRGFASIVIAMVMILVLSLITVGFAQLMRREQRSALDKQLSSQAYYAAESGVNQAVSAINAGYFQTTGIAKTTCGTIRGDTYFSKNTVGSDPNVSYPCLLVNPTPPSLQYSTIDTTAPKVVELEGLDTSSGKPTSISTIEVSWQDPNGAGFAPGCGSGLFKPAGSGGWTYTGLLKVELIALNDGRGNPAFDRTSLTNHAFTAFLCPNSSGSGQVGSLTYFSNIGAASGAIINGQCNSANPSRSSTASPPTPLNCNAQITTLNNLNESTFFLVMRSIYSATTVTIAAYDGSGTQLNIGDAQVLVDSTGKAQDVLRRVQVRVPVHNNYNLTDGVDAAASLCKQLQLTPASANNSSTSASCPVP
ncbi:MAG TPA: PilX N-terminal domain-containing pilus assembly protein [Candidatus Dormibacteraeota bacterium]|nr:PilX N-terminal domain-containing pilus assembly protein [Candidatus Dormibacteraeota bacterium]